MSNKILSIALLMGLLSTNILMAMDNFSNEVHKQKTVIWMKETDEKNPPKIFRLPLSMRVQNLSNELCKRVTTDLEK